MTDKINDGGSAFPGFGSVFTTDAQGRTAPQSAWGIEGAGGMTLRQWYAGQALIGILSGPSDPDINFDPERDAKVAYLFADAMIAEGRKT